MTTPHHDQACVESTHFIGTHGHDISWLKAFLQGLSNWILTTKWFMDTLKHSIDVFKKVELYWFIIPAFEMRVGRYYSLFFIYLKNYVMVIGKVIIYMLNLQHILQVIIVKYIFISVLHSILKLYRQYDYQYRRS